MKKYTPRRPREAATTKADERHAMRRALRHLGHPATDNPANPITRRQVEAVEAIRESASNLRNPAKIVARMEATAADAGILDRLRAETARVERFYGEWDMRLEPPKPATERGLTLRGPR